jgi:D-beta-D-heptose 7-phosphate kinase/D-beta-D-heptose 1-phosphate adenosyltransferase
MASALQKLVRVVNAFAGRRVGVAGDVMLDRYVWGKAGRLSPEAPVPVVEYAEERGVLGGAGNVAANLAALGARVVPFGVVGEDEFAAPLLGQFAALKMPAKGILADPARKTTVKTRIIAGHQQVVRVDRETRAPLDDAVEERLIRRIIGHLRPLDALVISDYDKGVVTEELAARVLAACRRLGIPAFVKPKWSREFRWPEEAPLRAVVLNRAEASFLVRAPLDDDEAVEKAGRDLLHRFRASVLVMTRGEEGLSVFEENKPRGLHIPATSRDIPYPRLAGERHRSRARQVFDVTGAGDTVLAVLALAMASGASVSEAALLANTAAGVVVGKLGTATVSPAELQIALRDLR